MKKLFVSVLFVAVTLGVFTSCDKEDDYDDSVGIEFRLRNEDFGGDKVFVFEVDSVTRIGGDEEYNHVYYRPEIYYLKISESNNFYVEGEHYEGFGIIACVGNVKGLGNIKTIPNSGWAGEVAVQPGMGYVVKSTNGIMNSKWHYARVYVKDWIESTDGGIIGAIIKYQSEWNVEE